MHSASALRAAVGKISSRLRGEHGVGLEVRVGLNTGDVLVIHDASTHEEQLVGNAVNLTKRFEEAAGPGEILLGDQTYRLVAEAVRAEPAEPVLVEGFPDHIPAGGSWSCSPDQRIASWPRWSGGPWSWSCSTSCSTGPWSSSARTW